MTSLEMPRSVKVAAIIWMSVGGLAIAMTGIRLIAGGVSTGAIVVLAIAAAFVMIGLQQFKGKPMDTLGNASGSLLIAAMQVYSVWNQIGTTPLPAVMVGVVTAGAMVAAGILALAGRTEYKAWRLAISDERCSTL